MPEPAPTYDDHADALAAMAAGEYPHPEDAPQRDAASEDEAGTGGSHCAEADDGQAPPEATPVEVVEDAEPIDPDPLVTAAADKTPADPDARQALAKRRQAAAQQSLHMQFKKTMAPVLFVAGALLLALAAAVAATGRFRRIDALGGKGGYLLLAVAFPLGVLLLVGGWLFRRDIRQDGNPR